jgi:hypothetical protein
MAETVQGIVAGSAVPFEIDIENGTWSGEPAVEEGDFPIPFDRGGKRYELYSDGTFAEVER